MTIDLCQQHESRENAGNAGDAPSAPQVGRIPDESTQGAKPNSIAMYSPVNLNLDDLPATWKVYAAWVVHHLYLQRHLDGRYYDGCYSPLSAKILESILPKRSYKAILSLLEDIGVIEGNHSYRSSDGRFRGWSKGYRLTSLYRDTPVRMQRLEHAELSRKLARLEWEREKELLPVHLHLKTMLKGLELAKDATFTEMDYNLLSIQNKDFRLTVCEQGRVFTNLTSLKRTLRKHIRWKGQSLWMIDITNSQPLILALTINKSKHYLSLTSPISTNLIKNAFNQGYIPYVPSLSSDGLIKDFQQFLQLCLQGKIYEAIAAEANRSRTFVKDKFFAVAYGSQRDMFTHVGKAFQKLLPHSFWALWLMKSAEHQGNEYSSDSGGAAIAKRMQRLESDLIIGKVCERLRKERPNACLLTIHDCLVTTQENLGQFSAILEDEFKKVHGVCPKLHPPDRFSDD